MVAVVDKNNKPLMPTSAYRARKLLRVGRAVIHKYRPYFTIRIVDLESGAVQPSLSNTKATQDITM